MALSSRRDEMKHGRRGGRRPRGNTRFIARVKRQTRSLHAITARICKNGRWGKLYFENSIEYSGVRLAFCIVVSEIE